MADINLTLGVDASDAESQMDGFSRTVRNAFNSSNANVNKLGVSLNKVTQDIQRTTSRMREIATVRIENPQLQATNQAIQQMENELERARVEQQRLLATNHTNTQAYTDITDAIRGLEIDLQRAVEYRDRLMSQPTQVVDNTQSEEYRALAQHLTNSVNQANILSHSIKQAIMNTLKLSNVVSKLKTLWSKVTGAVGKLRGALSKTGASHDITFKKMLNSVLKYVFGIRSIFIAYKKLRTVIKEGLKSMAKQFPEIASQVNSLNNAWWGFKSSIVSAFQPIFSYVVPALVTLITYLTSAMNTLANFFAVLTGQKFYYKAVKGNTSVAKSIGSTGSEAKKANEELAEYDKLLVIDQKDSGSGGSGGGGGGSDDGFNWVKEQTKSNDFIESLKKYWAEGDFEGLGKLISSKLTNMMNSIPWDSIYAKAKDFGKNLASFLNGLINPELFSALGKTIANALTTALIFLQSFGETFDWSNFGNSIAAGINSFFENFKFSDLADTFNTWSHGIFTTLITAINGIKWKDISKNITDGIKHFDAKQLGEDVGTLVTAIVTALYTLISNKDTWSSLGKKIADGINGVADTIDGKDLAKLLNAIKDALFTAISTAVKNIEWGEIGKDITDFLSNLDIGTIALLVGGFLITSGTGATLLSMATSALSATIGPIVSNLVTAGMANIGNLGMLALKVAGVVVAAAAAFKIGWEFGTTLGEFIATWFKNKGIISGESADGYMEIAESMSMTQKIEDIALSIKEGTAFDAWTEMWTDWFTPLFDEGKSIGIKIKEVAFSLAEGAKSIASAWTDFWGDVGEDIYDTVQVAVELAKSGWETVTGWVGSLAQMGSNAINTAVGLVQSGWSTVSSWVASFGTAVSSAVDLAQKGWTSVTAWVKSFGISVINNSIGLVKDGWTTVKSFVEDKAGGVVSKGVQLVKDGWTSVKSWIGDTGKAISQGIALAKSGWKTLTSFIGVNPKTALSQGIKLAKKGWASIFGFLKGTPMAKLNSLTLDVGVKLKQIGKAVGGVAKKAYNAITGKKAEGGSYYHGTWHAIPQYAKGTLNAGSLFVAGEAGPEIVGNVKGRTEVLNASQIASAIRTAVIDGMTAILNKVQGLNLNLNLSALSDIPPIPVIVTGQLLPLTEAFMFRFEEQHKDFEDVKLRLDDIIRRLSEGSNKEPIVVQVDGKAIVQLVWDETAKRYKQTGRNMLA